MLAACAASNRWRIADPGAPSAEQQARLVEAERLYRAGQPFDAQRAAIVADAATAWWFTRMVVHDVVRQREGRVVETETERAPIRSIPDFLARGRRARPGDSDALLRAAAGQRDAIEERAFAEIGRLGAAAVPCLVRDLAQHPQAQIRRIGAELLGVVGAPALPWIDSELVGSESPQHRAAAAQALGMMALGAETETRLRRLANDADYRVRGSAFTAMAEAGAPVAPLLRQALVDDADPFVRRMAARALATYRETASAQALVAYLQRCQREHDERGIDTAQTALQQMSRTNGVRGIDAWRTWAAAFAPDDKDAPR